MKKKLLKDSFYLCLLLLYFPLLFPWWLTDQKGLIRGDLIRWRKIWKMDDKATGYTLINACMKNSICRTIFFHRVKCGNFLGWFSGEILRCIYRPLPTLTISTHKIGPGFYIQHGYCTIVSARSIGTNVWVNQGVTIGYTNERDCPTIGNNVIVGAGAKVLGNIIIGNNVKIGANAVVVKNVPPNSVVAGVPAKIIRRGGQRVSENLV